MAHFADVKTGVDVRAEKAKAKREAAKKAEAEKEREEELKSSLPAARAAKSNKKLKRLRGNGRLSQYVAISFVFKFLLTI